MKSVNVIKVGLFQKTWALAQRMMPGPSQGADMRPPSGAPNSGEPSLGLADVNVISVAFQASALSHAEPGDRNEAAQGPSPSQPETLGPPSAANASVEALAGQVLTLVEVVSAQEADLKALKTRVQQLEEQDQAIMVAFTTFFHVLAAKRIARLEDIAAILHSIIATAEREAYPSGSIHFLQRLATMLQEPSGARAEQESR